MILRADFGWVILVAFLFWIFRVLQAGSRSSGHGRVPPPRLPSGPPQGTQREGSELEQLLLQLEGRLGARSGGQIEGRPKVTARRPPQMARVQTRSASPRRVPTDPMTDPTVVSLEVPVDREVEGEALERARLAAVAARNRELTDADHAAFEARIKSASGQPAASPSAAPRLTARHLRDAVLWREILGRPKGLQ